MSMMQNQNFKYCLGKNHIRIFAWDSVLLFSLLSQNEGLTVQPNEKKI